MYEALGNKDKSTGQFGGLYQREVGMFDDLGDARGI